MQTLNSKLARPLAVAVILILASSGTIVMISEAKASNCKPYPTQAVAVHSGKTIAKQTAQKNWMSSVKTSLGQRWAVWVAARKRNYKCVQLAKPKSWRCLAIAQPCLYISSK